jgi:hypothetical protein
VNHGSFKAKGQTCQNKRVEIFGTRSHSRAGKAGSFTSRCSLLKPTPYGVIHILTIFGLEVRQEIRFGLNLQWDGNLRELIFYQATEVYIRKLRNLRGSPPLSPPGREDPID